MNEQETYLTDDLWESAFLIAVGIPLIKTVPAGNQLRFIFSDGDGEATRQGRLWTDGSPAVPARALLKAWRFVHSTVARFHRGELAA